MAELYTSYIVKFDGSFDDMDKLNRDLRNSNSSFMEELIDTASECGIKQMDFFGISSNGDVGLISSDEGSVDDEHNKASYFYRIFDDEMADCIASHMTDGSKLIITFCFDIEDYNFIFEKDTWKMLEKKDLF